MAIVTTKGKHKSLFCQYILTRIRRNKNFIFIITGPTGSGKSWSAIRLGELLDRDFGIRNVVFNQQAFMELINGGDLHRGSVVVFDEAQVSLSSREWQSLTNRMLNYVLQTFRHRNIILLMTAPHFSFVDAQTRRLFHGYAETISIDVNEGVCRLKPMLIQTSQRRGDLYFKYLRVATGQGVTPLTRLIVSKPSESLIKQYEAKKTEFTTDLNQDILAQLKQSNERNTPKELTEIQSEVYGLIKQGKTDAEIADKLSKSSRYINRLRHTITHKGWTIEQ